MASATQSMQGHQCGRLGLLAASHGRCDIERVECSFCVRRTKTRLRSRVSHSVQSILAWMRYAQHSTQLYAKPYFFDSGITARDCREYHTTPLADTHKESRIAKGRRHRYIYALKTSRRTVHPGLVAEQLTRTPSPGRLARLCLAER